MNLDQFLASPLTFKGLNDFAPNSTEGADKHDAKERMKSYIKDMQQMQDMLYADDRHSILIIFQAMDGAGKDSTIKHVMSGINPQGCQVFSFKQPSNEELDHDFLWRTTRRLPERGRIGIFNRSYYEEVLILKVHPELLLYQRLPGINSLDKISPAIFEQRYKSINEFEEHMVRNGTVVIKFFLHLSREEQADRFLKRITEPHKNWKFSFSDLEERKYWDDYQVAYENMIKATSTSHAPWYIIPADKKWYMRLAVAEILLSRLKQLGLRYPVLTEKQLMELEKGKEILLKEVR